MFFGLIYWFLLAIPVLAKTHEYHFNTTLIDANPDGVHERKVIAVNGKWPLPIIRVRKNDRVIIHLTNSIPDRSTSLHFHGLFMKNQNSMDGPEHVTQCPIPPNSTFTYDFVVEQTGTYWYHLHLGSQYSDGLRGMFIIEEETKEDYPFEFDEEVPLAVSDWYHQESKEIMKLFKSRYNPTGAEPVPQNALFNDTRNVTWHVQPNTTYFLRVVNMGMFVSQFLYVEGHTFTVVEIDGVYVEPKETDSLYVAVAQRYGVLLKSRGDQPSNPVFRFVSVLDQPMLDVLPQDLQIVLTNYLQYGNSADVEKPEPLKNGKGEYEKIVGSLQTVDDFVLRPYLPEPLYDDYDYQIVLNLTMENLGDGVSYAFFNGITYNAPKVPTLYSALSSGKLATEAAIYGSNTNTFVLQYGEVIEIVLNNMDPGIHPFHLHGHTFQLVARSEGTDDEANPQIYNEKHHGKFPEHPMMRDTVMVNANGYIVLRFKAENPGVWLFHCHVDWHLEQGLAITLVEAPLEMQKDQKPIDDLHFAACTAGNNPTKGNAAGHFGSDADWLDLTGENKQEKPLPPGFTAKGYVALVACAAAALFGIFSIYQYGMEDISSDNAEHMVAKLYKVLEQYDTDEAATMLTLDSNGERVRSHGSEQS